MNTNTTVPIRYTLHSMNHEVEALTSMVVINLDVEYIVDDATIESLARKGYRSASRINECILRSMNWNRILRDQCGAGLKGEARKEFNRNWRASTIVKASLSGFVTPERLQQYLAARDGAQVAR